VLATTDLIHEAFERLSGFPGFVDRSDQKQLALLLADCIEGCKSGAFEAPTGLGKSLASLIPAIASAISTGKRIVIATYTNVLAEQYWRKDLPLALSLFEGHEKPRAQFLIGRQRYACIAAMAEQPVASTKEFRQAAKLGIESELRDNTRKFGRELTALWQQISAPPVCPSRLCPHYHDCYYYSARRGAERASIVITNHSVVLQDALLKKASEGELSMLGEYDFVILDEAHDFQQAALNSLEFELSENKLGLLANIVQRMQISLQVLALESGQPQLWHNLCDSFRQCLLAQQQRLKAQSGTFGQGILKATPSAVCEHPQVKARTVANLLPTAQAMADDIADMTFQFLKGIEALLSDWKTCGAITAAQKEDANDTLHNYSLFLKEFAVGCHMLFAGSTGEDYSVGVTYVSSSEQRATVLRHDVIGLQEPLRDLIWDAVPSACLSATLAIDGDFDFFRRMTGARPDFEEILPSPFDFSVQASLYIPKAGTIPDPALARKSGSEDAYYDALASEVSRIIETVGGRTLALFHSRREMEGVHQRLTVDDDYPVYMQRGSGAGWVGERFKKEVNASLFGVRSFWTGFDAPGETLSCVILARVPFEVPIDPPQIARLAWLQTQGLEPFSAYSLPQAKMMMRQGAGRLIRTSEDIGVIAILDPRVKTKNYGEQILENLPTGMRVYDDIEEAAMHLRPLVV
jgi:ATP-dependent DNA helicase DinG